MKILVLPSSKNEKKNKDITDNNYTIDKKCM